eukprot:255964_1
MATILSTVLLFVLEIYLTLGGKVVDSEVVCLYEEWDEPVEKIETEDRLFELVPKMGQGTTENNILLHLYADECSEDVSHPFFIGAHYQTGPAVLHLAQMNYESVHPSIFTDWDLPQNCSAFVMIPIHKTYNQFREFSLLTDDALPSFTAWIHQNRESQAYFTNNFGKEVKFYWYEKNPKFLDVIQPNQVRTEHTFLGHIFRATDAADDSFIDLYVVDGQQYKSISREPMYEWCRASGHTPETAQCIEEYEAEMIDWVYKFWARKREALNFVQPKIVPNFTAIGFKKTRLPEDVFTPVFQFWKTRQAENSFTGEGYAGPVLNQYSAPTAMAHLESSERNLLITHFQKVLSEWAGFDDPNALEMTSLYGIRQYSRGAVLHMHVDTCSTHVISAIVNVDSQLDEGKDWPLQIYDHQDILHELTMKPGDVVFYESAKCGHSRRKPLPGQYYSNLFIHFKPRGAWNFDWF